MNLSSTRGLILGGGSEWWGAQRPMLDPNRRQGKSLKRRHANTPQTRITAWTLRIGGGVRQLVYWEGITTLDE